jgi:hypothetical protein
MPRADTTIIHLFSGPRLDRTVCSYAGCARLCNGEGAVFSVADIVCRCWCSTAHAGADGLPPWNKISPKEAHR